MFVHSEDADIYYEVLGAGPDLVLLHAFPLNHHLWRPIAERLASSFRVILMDLRGHGSSGVGQGPATMEKHAADVGRVCDATGVGKAAFGGVSIGGYVLFEFWRRARERISGLILADTKAAADTEPARLTRLQSAEDVEKNGPAKFLDVLATKLVGESTQRNRPDLVKDVRAMMDKMTLAGIAAAQRGMAARPDSTSTLKTINVPALLLFGEEDTVTPFAEGELMGQQIANSRLQIIPRGGHLAVFEQQDASYVAVRKFLDRD
jgi:3-oxoadipate enol-lactonase